LAASLPLFAQSAFAMCVAPAAVAGHSPAESHLIGKVRDSAAVFYGEVIGFDYIPDDSVQEGTGKLSGLGKAERRVVRLLPHRWWKGEQGREVRVAIGGTRYANGMSEVSSEDYPMDLGKKYLVFARADQGKLSTSACSGNRTEAEAAELMDLLDQLRASF